MLKQKCLIALTLIVSVNIYGFKNNTHTAIKHREYISNQKWQRKITETSKNMPRYQANSSKTYTTKTNAPLFIFFTTMLMLAQIPDRSFYHDASHTKNTSHDPENKTDWNKALNALLPGGYFTPCASWFFRKAKTLDTIKTKEIPSDSPYASWVLHDPFLQTNEFKNLTKHAYQEIDDRCSHMKDFDITLQDTPSLYRIFVEHHMQPALKSRNITRKIPLKISCFPDNNTQLVSSNDNAFNALARIYGKIKNNEIKMKGNISIYEGLARFYLTHQAPHGELSETLFHEMQHVIDFINREEKPNVHHEIYKNYLNKDIIKLPPIYLELLADFYANIAVFATKNNSVNEYSFLKSSKILGNKFTKKDIKYVISQSHEFSKLIQEDTAFYLENEEWLSVAIANFAEKAKICKNDCDSDKLIYQARELYKNHKLWDEKDQSFKDVYISSHNPYKRFESPTHPAIYVRIFNALNPFCTPTKDLKNIPPCNRAHIYCDYTLTSLNKVSYVIKYYPIVKGLIFIIGACGVYVIYKYKKMKKPQQIKPAQQYSRSTSQSSSRESSRKTTPISSLSYEY